MDISLETLKVLLILMPGFVASIVLDAIVVRKRREGLAAIVEALVFSFLIYALITIAHWLFGDQKTSYPTVTDPRILLEIFLVALTLPLAIGAFVNNDLHMVFLRKTRITHRTARDTTWLDVFMEQERYVVVTLTDGRRVFGWPMYYSDNPEEGLLYLYEPSWVNDDGTYTDLDVHGLFLVQRDGIDSIAFTHVARENAVQAGNMEVVSGNDQGSEGQGANPSQGS